MPQKLSGCRNIASSIDLVVWTIMISCNPHLETLRCFVEATDDIVIHLSIVSCPFVRFKREVFLVLKSFYSSSLKPEDNICSQDILLLLLVTNVPPAGSSCFPQTINTRQDEARTENCCARYSY